MERILKDQIASLNGRIEELSQIKGEMEALLKQEKELNVKLERMLGEEREDKDALLQKHRVELDDLHQKLVNKSEEQMKELEKDIVAKMKLAIAKVETQADESLKKEKAKSDKLEKEKQAALDAVEQEKAKMRKLVKVLSNKEKQEIASSSSVGISQSDSNKMQRPVVSTQRGQKP